MLVYKVSSPLSIEQVLERIGKREFLILARLFTKEEMDLAYFLAKKAFEKKKNIARKFAFEFLLYLVGKRDIKKAIEVTLPEKSPFFLVSFESEECTKKFLKEIEAKYEKAKLAEKASSIDIERIALRDIL